MNSEDSAFLDEILALPVPDTEEERKILKELLVYYYTRVEQADMGAGYQIWQIVLMSQIQERLKSLK